MAVNSLTLAPDAKASKNAVFRDRDTKSVFSKGSKQSPRRKVNTRERSHVGIVLSGLGLSIAKLDRRSEMFLSPPISRPKNFSVVDIADLYPRREPTE
jgi:hypothetical protein